jgi:hypothetical protein
VLLVAFDFAIGGKINQIDPVRDASEPVYVAVYDLADPSVCSSDEWVSVIALLQKPTVAVCPQRPSLPSLLCSAGSRVREGQVGV